MGDDDELGVPRQLAHVPGVPGDVDVIQGGLDLIHDAKRRGVHFQNGEVQCNGHKSLLATGEQGDGLEGLSRGLGLDLDAAAQDVTFILQLQRGLAAAEELCKCGLEALRKEFELLGEDRRHLVRDVLDDACQFLLGLLHVVPLPGEIGIAPVHPVKFFNGADVDAAQSVDVPLKLPDAAGRLGDALQLDPLGLGVRVAEFIVFPQPIQDLLFLHSAGGDLLLQPGNRPLQI